LLVMQKGRLVEEGPVEEVLGRPKNEYTQKLLADVPRLHPV
ncbi:MAG: ABC transporter ATP-binding protein, partial [Firmicutes bacterium]|nr:ABC transporter ATP-binding protein [Bacillota bacterium]